MIDRPAELEDFARVYREHLDLVLAYCFRRTGDRELAADLAAEVFAAALRDRDRYEPQRAAVGVWLLGIAAHKTADALRRGYVARRAQQRLGILEIAWSEDDLEHVARAAEDVQALLAALPADQRQAVQARIVDESEYAGDRGDARRERGRRP
jgi:RNA polymerase sigma factor (sigma-70 family)